MKKFLTIILLVFTLASCENKRSDDIVTEPNKEGSIETVVSVKHDENFDILTTTHKVWVQNKLDTTLTKIDTIKSLGKALVEGVNEKGDAEKTLGRKDYEFYITVK